MITGISYLRNVTQNLILPIGLDAIQNFLFKEIKS